MRDSMRRRSNKTLGMVVGIVVALWIVLGGLVIEVDDEVEGIGMVRTAGCDHKAWVQASDHLNRMWFLGVTRQGVGPPYVLRFASTAEPGTHGSVVIDMVVVTGSNGEHRAALPTPIRLEYEAKPYTEPYLE